MRTTRGCSSATLKLFGSWCWPSSLVTVSPPCLFPSFQSANVTVGEGGPSPHSVLQRLWSADDSEAPAKSVFLMGYSVGPLKGVLENLLVLRARNSFVARPH